MSDKKKRIVIPSEEEVSQFGGDAGDSTPETPGANPGEPGEADPKPGEAEAHDQNAEAPEALGDENFSADAAQWRDKYLRAKAELVNFQRRAEKDRSDALRYAYAPLVRSLLPIIDDLERVIASGEEHKDNAQAILDGVRLVFENFVKSLREHQVERIEAQGEPFDPAVHEAMMEQPSAEHAERTVLQEVARGYRLHDRVLRPAKVIVSKPMDEASGQQEGSADEADA